METCPFCSSEDIYFSKKRKLFVCEDCDKTFTEQQSSATPQSTDDNRGLNLFLSYGHDRNRVIVERIKQDLEKRGHNVWIDTSEIKTGDNWRNSILNGVLNSSKIIAFLSEHSTRIPGVCLDELKIAICVKGADIKTVLLEPEEKINQPATLSDIQWLDMSEWYEIKQAEKDFEQWYKSKFTELCKVIESNEAVDLSGSIQFLKEKLSTYLNSEKEYHLLSKEFFGRNWLKTYIDNWKENKSTKALIVYGKPGTGKSAFSVNYSHYNAEILGCFLCEWNKEYSINPNRLIRTMAFRLATKLSDYRTLLIQQLQQDDLQLNEMKDDALFDFLLTYPLNHLVDGNRKVGLIIVDGLDEAEKNGDNPLAALFSHCVDRMPRWIRFIFTSRPERNVSSFFQSYESINLVDDMPAGYNDIMVFLTTTLAKELDEIPNKLEILYRICELSEGAFLYAEMMAEDIKNKIINIDDIEGFPKGLNAFYRISMERKFKSEDEFLSIRKLCEILTVADSIPEKLIVGACDYSQYTYLTVLDELGSWVNRQEDNNISILGFSHKSLTDWFTNFNQSGKFYVDKKTGALLLARYCRKQIEQIHSQKNKINDSLMEYIKSHIGTFYVEAEEYSELEDFLLQNTDELYPYWLVWKDFPLNWNHNELMNVFWESNNRNLFVRLLQREGNTNYLLWLFDKVKTFYEVKKFDRDLVSVYMDIVHMSGRYSEAVDIAYQYLQDKSIEEISNDEFLALLNVRKIHHSMFYKPVQGLIDDALNLYEQLGNRFPFVMNELLFLIGGNLGVLSGDWNFVKEWLSKSSDFANANNLKDFHKRNARKQADYYCYIDEYEKGIDLIRTYVLDEQITGRYENYLVGALGNLYTCLDCDDDAMKCYENVLKFSTAKGIIGWAAHANLGIANINYKIGNTEEAIVFANRANTIYKRINHEWGLIMSEALLSVCGKTDKSVPKIVLCANAIDRAKRMQYGSCIKSIEDFCSGQANYLKLYFL